MSHLLVLEATNAANLAAQLVQRNRLLDVGDHDLAAVGDLHLDFGRIRVAVIVGGIIRWQHSGRHTVGVDGQTQERCCEM